MSLLLEKLRNELVDIVEWIDHASDVLVWRFPRYNNQIKNGAQLIVRPGQLAVFVHRGRLGDTFQPGHYTLTTDNLPILSTLQGWLHGFDSPFKSEVYFINTRQVTDLKWGTPNPIMLRDADFGPVRLRAFGTYTLKVLQPAVLLQELVGTDEAYEADEINELMRSIIHSSLADLLGRSDIAVLDLARNYRTLSEKLRVEVVSRVAQEYGLDVPHLYIVNISLPEAVEKALDTRTSMNVIGDLDRHQKYQAGQAMTLAAQNPNGAAAMGVGLAMGGTISTGAAAAALIPPSAPSFVPTSNDAAWYIVDAGQTIGPLTPAQLRQAGVQGHFQPATLVWTAGMPTWLPASQVLQLSQIFQPPPPPRT